MTRTLVAILFLIVASAHGESRYTQRMFRRAMARDNLAVSGSFSTAPLYVLITVCQPKPGKDRLIAVTANLLSGAIHMEHHLSYDVAGDRREFEIAMAQPNRRFCFRSPKAAGNIPIDYSPAILAKVRHRLSDMSVSQLRAELARQGWRGSVEWWHTRKYQDAVAHVLLERGILVGQADITGALFPDK
ncbi:MAG: hypothetical protein WAO00_14005 [Chthoniobacterales bacterium]